jgi:hypothetical protein
MTTDDDKSFQSIECYSISRSLVMFFLGGELTGRYPTLLFGVLWTGVGRGNKRGDDLLKPPSINNYHAEISWILPAGLSKQKKRSGAKMRSRGQKSTPGGKNKCSREHLSRALLRSMIFLAINNKVAEANHHTSYLSPLLHHYCRHCAAADSSPKPPPTQPTPSPPAAAGQ